MILDGEIRLAEVLILIATALQEALISTKRENERLKQSATHTREEFAAWLRAKGWSAAADEFERGE